jgi:hypothetical protein
MYEAWVLRCSKLSVISRGLATAVTVCGCCLVSYWLVFSSVLIERSNLGLALCEVFLTRSGTSIGSGSLMISFDNKFKFSKSYYLSHSTYTSTV